MVSDEDADYESGTALEDEDLGDVQHRLSDGGPASIISKRGNVLIGSVEIISGTFKVTLSETIN